MVMRKFRKSVDHGDSEEQLNQSSAAPSPRVSKKLINGQDSLGLPPGSPSVRRRRSRIPSEEDDQLINFLVTGSNDGTGGPGSRERNASTGALGNAITNSLSDVQDIDYNDIPFRSPRLWLIGPWPAPQIQGTETNGRVCV